MIASGASIVAGDRYGVPRSDYSTTSQQTSDQIALVASNPRSRHETSWENEIFFISQRSESDFKTGNVVLGYAEIYAN
jgi:hypothetical protein